MFNIDGDDGPRLDLGLQSNTIVGVPLSDLMGGSVVNPMFTPSQEASRAIDRVQEG